MDFLGLTTLTLIDDALKMIEKRHGVQMVLEDLPLDDPRAYEIFCKGFTSGMFQFESPGMRDILRRYQPTPHRRSDRAERAVSPRPDSGRHARRFHRAQAWPQGGGLRSAGAEGDSGRDLRRHPLSGTGDADLEPRWRAIRWAMRICCAAPWARRRPRRWRSSASASSQGAAKRASAEEGRKDLRPDGAVRGLRLQQVALGRVCVSWRSSRPI